MILTSRTQQLCIVALLFAAMAIGAAVYLFTMIQRQGAQLDSYVHLISESTRQAEEYSRVERQVEETEADRARLRKFFFEDQTDSLNFLAEVEQNLAKHIGVALQTTDIATVADAKRPDESEIRISFRYTGSEQAVLDFSRLLEVLPYHSRVDSLVIKAGDAGNWQGEVTIFITVQKSV